MFVCFVMPHNISQYKCHRHHNQDSDSSWVITSVWVFHYLKSLHNCYINIHIKDAFMAVVSFCLGRQRLLQFYSCRWISGMTLRTLHLLVCPVYFICHWHSYYINYEHLFISASIHISSNFININMTFVIICIMRLTYPTIDSCVSYHTSTAVFSDAIKTGGAIFARVRLAFVVFCINNYIDKHCFKLQ